MNRPPIIRHFEFAQAVADREASRFWRAALAWLGVVAIAVVVACWVISK